MSPALPVLMSCLACIDVSTAYSAWYRQFTVTYKLPILDGVIVLLTDTVVLGVPIALSRSS